MSQALNLLSSNVFRRAIRKGFHGYGNPGKVRPGKIMEFSQFVESFGKNPNVGLIK